MVLTGIRNYTERIIATLDVRKLIGCLDLNNNHTEFFDRQTVSDVAVDIECMKELISIYMEIYISLMKLYTENNENINHHISTDVKLHILRFSHGNYHY